jgi:hypothetical protein
MSLVSRPLPWCASLVLVYFCFVLPAALMSQQSPGWQWQNPLPQGNTINSVRFAPDKKYG